LIFNSSNSASLCERLRWCHDAAKGLAWLHKNNPCIIHRDIKPSNLLIDARGTVKVTDFGLADLIQQGQQFKEVRPRGSPIYMAPEVMTRSIITPKVDVYSFGILVWEIVKKEAAFAHHSDYAKFSKAVLDGERPSVEGLHPELGKFLTRCWAKDPKDRPDFTDICSNLDDIILSVGIEDDNARQFWKFNFPGKYVVPSTELIKKMYQSIDRESPFPADETQPLIANASDQQISNANPAQRREFARRNYENFRKVVTMFGTQLMQDIDYQVISIKLLLNNSSSDDVDVEKFGQFIGLLGPFDKKLLDRVASITKTNWFHGILTKAEAESRLSNEKPGTFLVRFSANNPGCYVISKVATDRSPKHILIAHNKDGSFSTKVKDAKTYPTFEDLLKAEGKANNLLTCSPNSVFQTLCRALEPYQVSD